MFFLSISWVAIFFNFFYKSSQICKKFPKKKNPLTPQKQIIDSKIDAHVELKMKASIKVQSESSILEKDMKMQIMEMLAFCSQSTRKDTIPTTQVQHKIILQSSSYKKRMLY
jgi:hypothetical protein